MVRADVLMERAKEGWEVNLVQFMEKRKMIKTKKQRRKSGSGQAQIVFTLSFPSTLVRFLPMDDEMGRGA